MCEVSHHLIKEFENIEKDELIRMYNNLVNHLVTLPETELEFICIRVLRENGKMRLSAMMLFFQHTKHTRYDVSKTLSSLVKKQLINRDGLFFYSSKEQQNEQLNAG